MRGKPISRGTRDVDTVLVAARYAPDDRRLTHLRAYERRGAVWTDSLLLNREELLEQLRAGRRVVTGAARALPGDFQVIARVERRRENGRESIVAGESAAIGDDLDLPRF